MGDWADLMDSFGGRIPKDIADAQMVPKWAQKRAPKPRKTVGASKPPKGEKKPEKS